MNRSKRPTGFALERIIVWTALALGAAACSADEAPLGELAEAFRSEGQEPIRVLTVTATHGFRHAPAIATTKELLAALTETTEFEFDVTEDVDDLNAANLARYDLLFFANATLRVDEPTDDAIGFVETITYQPGDWKNFDVVLKTPQQDLPGRLALSGGPGSLSGMIDFGTGTRVIDEATLDGDQLRLRWSAGPALGVVVAELTLRGDTIDGHMTLGGQPVPLAGVANNAQKADEGLSNPITAAHRAAISDFIAGGNGFVGAHSALDALYGWGEYRRIVGGGLFDAHPWTQEVRITIEDTANPAAAHFGDEFVIRDEIYVLDANPRSTSHVLASLDISSVEAGSGMRTDYPMSWLRAHNGGRVFVTKLGHFPEVWTNPAFVKHLLQGMRMAAGRLPADFSNAGK